MKHDTTTDYAKLTHDEVKGLRADLRNGNIKAYVVATEVDAHLKSHNAVRPTAAESRAGGR